MPDSPLLSHGNGWVAKTKQPFNLRVKSGAEIEKRASKGDSAVAIVSSKVGSRAGELRLLFHKENMVKQSTKGWLPGWCTTFVIKGVCSVVLEQGSGQGREEWWCWYPIPHPGWV